MTTKLYRTVEGLFIDRDGVFYRTTIQDWDELINTPNLLQELNTSVEKVDEIPVLMAPLGSQEVWAAGVTYLRSREARKEEVGIATGGSGDYYTKVYEADRPELFFKALPRRVSAPNAAVRIRRDSKWQVPEPELAVIANQRSEIVGWTIGNDMSARDMEGENPLYLPQAKIWEGSCSLGPALVVGPPPCPETEVELKVFRDNQVVTSASTSLGKMKRNPNELVDWLFRECDFPEGVVLLTGTGIVPENDFTLQSGDTIHISIQPAGVLINFVA